MSAADSRDTLARQWELLKLIPARGNGATAEELHRQLDGLGFPTTRRTVERDLAQLCSRFPFSPVEEGVRPLRWRWLPGSSLSLPGISLAEALSLNVIENTLRPLLPSALLGVLDARWKQARDKLSDLAETNQHAGWIDKVRVVPSGQALIPPTIADGVLEAIQEGLARGRQIKVRYQRAGADEPSPMDLHPIALVQSGPTTYLLAMANEHADVWTYALHRFKSADVRNEQARRLEGLDVDDAVDKAMQFGGGQSVRVRARIWDSLADILKETPLADDQVLGAGRHGWHNLTATVTDTWALRRWLLGHADEMVVTHPAGLRRDIARRLRDAADRYGVMPDTDAADD